ncbi:BatD family protein [Sinorhizobium chiapasense]|uniref:BatD family protein n=1 Tax=Sinorhizobium chiapasense TaxID=501572 RepID=A0ABZ2BIE5_9HYPH
MIRVVTGVSALMLALLACLLMPAGPAAAADPFARATLATKGTLYTGQEVHIDVDVFVPNYFLAPPQFPLFDLSGAVVTIPDGRGMNLNETVNGESFSGIRKSYVVTPQTAGDYTLPPAEIPFGYAAVPGQLTEGKVTLPPLKFTVEAAPGGAGGEAGVTAVKVTVDQALDRDASGLHAGDALVRTITVRAEGLDAMMIPEPNFGSPVGARVYVHDPALSEERTPRGEPVAGIRKDAATYVFAQAGSYRLPAIDVEWFDPQTGNIEQAEAPMVAVTVAAAPTVDTALGPPAPEPQKPPFDWQLWAGVGAATVIAAALIWLAARLLNRVESWGEAWHRHRLDSEREYFRRIEQACRDHDLTRLGRTLDAWSRKTGNAPLSRWLDRFADAATQRLFAEHQRLLYGKPSEGRKKTDFGALRSGLRNARRNWLRSGPSATARPAALPPLNPDFARPVNRLPLQG